MESYRGGKDFFAPLKISLLILNPEKNGGGGGGEREKDSTPSGRRKGKGKKDNQNELILTFSEGGGKGGTENGQKGTGREQGKKGAAKCFFLNYPLRLTGGKRGGMEIDNVLGGGGMGRKGKGKKKEPLIVNSSSTGDGGRNL